MTEQRPRQGGSAHTQSLIAGLRRDSDTYYAALEDAAEHLRLAATWIVDTDRHDTMMAAHHRAKEALRADLPPRGRAKAGR